MVEREVRLIFKPNAPCYDFSALPYVVAEKKSKTPTLADTLIITGWYEQYICFGIHEDIDRQIDVERCKELNIPIVRKLVSGGTLIHGPEHMLFTLISDSEFFQSLEHGCEIFTGKIMLGAYHELGISDVHYRPLNDILLGTKKVTGCAVARPHANVMVSAAGTNLFRPELELYEQLVRLPKEKFADKKAKSVFEWVTSIEEATGLRPAKEEMKDAFVRSFEKVTNTKVIPSELTDNEKSVYTEVYKLISSEEWTFRSSSKRRFANISAEDKSGHAKMKSGKLIVIDVLISDNKIKDIMISGDFMIYPQDAISILENALKHKSTNERIISSIVTEFFESSDISTAGMTSNDLICTINSAIGNAEK